MEPHHEVKMVYLSTLCFRVLHGVSVSMGIAHSECVLFCLREVLIFTCLRLHLAEVVGMVQAMALVAGCNLPG